MISYDDWSVEELIEARGKQLEVVREAVGDLHIIQLEIARRGKTRRQMKFEEGKEWVGY